MRNFFFPFILLAASPAPPNLVNDVRGAIAKDDFPRAAEIIRGYRAASGVTPEVTEALSWMARGSLDRKNLVEAEKYALETYQLSQDQLKKRALDQDPNLQIALLQ